MSKQQRMPRKFHVYYWIMRHIYPYDSWLYKLSADYRAWWGPR